MKGGEGVIYRARLQEALPSSTRSFPDGPGHDIQLADSRREDGEDPAMP